jgi:hypothetical protein
MEALMSDEAKPKRLLSTKALCTRWDRTDRSIDRYIALGIIPPPLWISGRRFWPEEQIEAVERAGIGAKPVVTRFVRRTEDSAA